MTFVNEMLWISVLFLILIHCYENYCTPSFPPCYQELRNAVEKSEIPPPKEALVTKSDSFEIGVKAISIPDDSFDDLDNDSPCKRAVVSERIKIIPSPTKKTISDSDIWDSYIDTSQHAHMHDHHSGCGNQESNAKAAQRHNEQKHQMFEGLLKLTTILNRIDSFFTNKAKGLINGLHKMMQSEEDEGGHVSY